MKKSKTSSAARKSRRDKKRDEPALLEVGAGKRKSLGAGGIVSATAGGRKSLLTNLDASFFSPEPRTQLLGAGENNQKQKVRSEFNSGDSLGSDEDDDKDRDKDKLTGAPPK